MLCASSTDPDAVKALFGDERASVIYSDPPFNIGLDYNKGVGNKSNYGGNVDDNKSAEEYKEFIRKTLVNALQNIFSRKILTVSIGAMKHGFGFFRPYTMNLG